ncbi:MAG: hypothetical protein NTU43_09535, partial [Bacteroidetes bacterium]|nr:hypothetical protein [Bacteroidota bacterium]
SAVLNAYVIEIAERAVNLNNSQWMGVKFITSFLVNNKTQDIINTKVVNHICLESIVESTAACHFTNGMNEIHIKTRVLRIFFFI